MVIMLLRYLIGNLCFWYGLSVFVGIFFISMFFKSHKKEKSCFLSTLIKMEREKLCKRDKLYTLKNWWNQIYFPSWLSFFIVLIIIGILFFFIFILQISNIFSPKIISLVQHYSQNLLVIHSTIGAIIFTLLIIFIAESLKEYETKDKAHILLKESFLFPLAVAIILTFFTFIWINIILLTIILVLAIGILTIISVSRLILISLNKHRFFKKRIELLKDRFKRGIELEIDERLGNNILAKRLGENEIELIYNPFPIDDKSRFYCFPAYKKGIITDINLVKLNEFAKIVESEANKNGLSFSKNITIIKPPVEAVNTDTLLETAAKKYIENQNRYLIKKYKDKINEEDDMLCVDKVLIKDKNVIKKLEKINKQIFVIRTKEDDFSEQIRAELMGIKDQFLNAINNKNIGKISDFITIYLSLAEAFLESLKEYGAIYTFELAIKERSAIIGGWNEIRWILGDIREIFKRGTKSSDKDIINMICLLPIAIANKAINFNDHYLFQEFIRFAEYLYMVSQKEHDTDLKSFMIDRSWKWLKESADYIVESKLREKGIAKELLLSLKDFAIYYFIVFQNLLREAYKNNDLGSFKQFNKTTSQLFSHFKPSKEYPSAEMLRRHLEDPETSEDQKRDIQTQLEEKELLERIEEEIKNRRKQMFFGLSSYIFEDYRIKSNKVYVKNFYLEVQNNLPNDLKELTKNFLLAHTSESEDFWGWHWWDIIPDGQVRAIDIFGKLERLYCIKALQILEGKTEEEIEKIELPYNRDLAFLVEEDGNLMKILDNIQNNLDSWKFVLSQNAIGKINSFKKILRKAKQRQEEAENELKRSAKISAEKVDEFKQQVIKGFYESAVIRDIFKNYKIYYDKTKKTYIDKLTRYGVKVVDDKAAFFEDWHVHYVDWERHYGKNLAFGEDSDLIEKISNQCIEVKDIEPILNKFDNVSDIIIIAIGMESYWHFSNSANFRPEWYKDIPQLKVNGFMGWYVHNNKNIPIFKVYNIYVDNKILILNKSKLGMLIQYSPLNKEESSEFKKDIFCMNIQSFSENEELIGELIEEQPEWLKKIGDKEAQIKHLETQVLISIFERFEYKKAKDFEGYILKLKD